MLSKFIWIIITFFKIPGFWFLSRSLFFFISFSAASFAVAWNDKELSRISRGISCGSVSKCVEVVLMLFFSSPLVFLSFVRVLFPSEFQTNFFGDNIYRITSFTHSQNRMNGWNQRIWLRESSSVFEIKTRAQTRTLALNQQELFVRPRDIAHKTRHWAQVLHWMIIHRTQNK